MGTRPPCRTPPAGEPLNRPFARLNELLAARSVRLAAQGAPPPEAVRTETTRPDPAQEAAEFARAMNGVCPIDRGRIAEAEPAPPPAAALAPPAPVEELAALCDLVRSGKGFTVADTPEYMEGVSPPAPPEIARRLHRGDFAVGAHLDLHGMSVAQARLAFDAFMGEAVRDGRGAVLIIHGRGLSSPGEPVLKTRVAEWISSGPWRRWVLAFTSARLCDGGAGASYVLLRRRPIGRKQRRWS